MPAGTWNLGRLRKRVEYVGLKDLNIPLVDQSTSADRYFNTVEFPTTLTGGKNLFKLKANANRLVRNSKLHIYPDPLQYRTRAALAEYSGIPLESIIVGAGADELIDLIFRLFISPGDIIVDFEPTFGMYSFCAEIAGADVFYVSRDSNFNMRHIYFKTIKKG